MLAAIQQLLLPPPGMDVDFKAPAGAPALFPSDGISWTIFSNPVALFIGGVSAVLLELAEPAVRSGVWDHSSFRRDPGMRLRRTGFAAMVTVYAPAEQAGALIGRVVTMHERVNGVTPDGQPYRANDPRLLDWVQATASFGFIEAYHRYVRTLTPAEKDAALTEGAAASRLYGAVGAPRSWQEWDDLLASTAPRLEGSDVLSEFLSIMSNTPLLPGPTLWLQRLLIRAAVEMTPNPVRSLPQLRGKGLRAGEQSLVRVLGRVAGALPAPQTPAAQAAARIRRGEALKTPMKDD
jgi:uncharacterized protein (DUF2236 family)